MAKRKVFYFDSDGCLAKWRNVDVSLTHKPLYFFNLDPEWPLIELLLFVINKGHEAYIMTKAYPQGQAARDKGRFYDKYRMKHVPRIFVPYDVGSKEDYVVDKNAENILIDDYTENLNAWESAGYKGIKFMNGINGTKGTWKGERISRDMSLEEMYNKLMNA